MNRRENERQQQQRGTNNTNRTKTGRHITYDLPFTQKPTSVYFAIFLHPHLVLFTIVPRKIT